MPWFKHRLLIPGYTDFVLGEISVTEKYCESASDEESIVEYSNDLSKSYTTLGMVYIAKNDFGSALVSLKKAYDNLEKIIRQPLSDPVNEDVNIWMQAMCLNAYGIVKAKKGDNSAARYIRKSIKVLGAIVNEHSCALIIECMISLCLNLYVLSDNGSEKELLLNRITDYADRLNVMNGDEKYRRIVEQIYADGHKST